jgi:hypothetical protein
MIKKDAKLIYGLAVLNSMNDSMPDKVKAAALLAGMNVLMIYC